MIDMTRYLDVTNEAAISLLTRGLTGPIVNLNLLRFNDIADYSAHPDLAPDQPISGAAAYQAYEQATLPILHRYGGEVIFSATGGNFLIGPQNESWDHILLVRQSSVENFFAMAQDPDIIKTIGHRTAAICDSRLLVVKPSSERN